MSETEKKFDSDLYGLGGILAYVQIILVFNFIRVIYLLVKLVRMYELNTQQTLQLLFASIYGISTILSLVAIVLCLVSLWRKSMLFRAFFISIYAISFIQIVLSGILYDASSFLSLIGLAIGAGIWVTYTFKSERVKNTLRKIGEEKTEFEIYMEEENLASKDNDGIEVIETI